MFINLFNIIKDNFYFSWFALLLFFIGFCFSIIVDQFDIKFLKAFPKWFVVYIARIVNPGSNFFFILLFIFLFNSISIMVYMSLGVFLIPPFLIAFLTGLNIGITMFIPNPYEKDPETNDVNTFIRGSAFKIMLYSTLVLILEVLAFSLGLGMGMSLAVAAAFNYRPVYIFGLLYIKLASYIAVCVPMLLLSAYLEASVIKASGGKV